MVTWRFAAPGVGEGVGEFGQVRGTREGMNRSSTRTVLAVVRISLCFDDEVDAS